MQQRSRCDVKPKPAKTTHKASPLAATLLNGKAGSNTEARKKEKGAKIQHNLAKLLKNLG